MHISVTVMATDSAVTALSVATTFTMICTSMFHKCGHYCHSAVSCHRCHTSVHSNVTALSLPSLLHGRSVYIADTLMLMPSLSQCYLGHCCHNTVKYFTILSLPPMLH